MSRYLKYEENRQVYYASGTIDIPDNCNGYTVTNTGGNIVYADDTPLYPGEVGSTIGDSISKGGNAGEVMIRKGIKIQFAAVDSNPQVEIIFKCYVD